MCFLLDLSVLLERNLNVETGLSALHTTQKGLQAHPVPGLVRSVRPSHEATTCAVLPGDKGNHDTGPRLGKAALGANLPGPSSRDGMTFERARTLRNFCNQLQS
jgi:hypothetical protein